MNRATATALATALALGGAACDSTTRPIEPTAQVDDCARCHGYPPPAFIAGGTTHTTSTQCSACHPGTVEADNVTIVAGGLHLNGVVDVAGGAGHAVPYVAEHPADALANIASCTACHGADYAGGDVGVSCNGCHADDATYPALAPGFPDWKTNCTFCHGLRTAGVTTATRLAAPPQAVLGATATTDPKVGAHQAHLAQGSIAGAMPCASCHAVPAGAEALTHFTGNGAPGAISFSAFATSGVTGAAYSGGTCNVYCHGAGTAFGSPAGKVSPPWTSSGVTCTTCHGKPPASHPAGSTDCNACHPGTVAADNVTINVAGGLHVNGVKDATSAHPADWALPSQHGYSVNATGLSSCKTCHGTSLTGGSGPSCASCHGTGWDTDCTFCHGNPSTGRMSPPVDTQGRSVTSNVSVGTHDAHVATTIANPLGCSQCHPARGSSVITDAAHIDGNGIAEVAFGALARTGGAAAAYARASATSATCSSVYCHGQFTGGSGWDPSWTSTTQATCTSCHGAPPSTGQHQRHSGSQFTCSECHGTGYSATTVNATNHVNGTKNVPFSSSVTSPVPPPVFSGSCTLTCHGKGHSNETW